MSTLAVARKDFKGARRAKTLWIVAALLALIGGLFAYVGNADPGQSDAEVVREMMFATGQLMSFLLPIVVMVASYLAIAGERENGGIKFLLSLPNTRRDVVVGKYLSRTVVSGLAVSIMFAVILIVGLIRFGAFPAPVVLGITALTLVYAAAFVSVAVAFSAFVGTRSRAVAGAVSSYFLLVIVQLQLPVISVTEMVSFVTEDVLGMDANPDLYNFVLHLSPFWAFRKAINLVVPQELRIVYFEDSADNVQSGFAQGVDPELPVYLTDEFSLVILAGWIVVPLLIGYWRFQRADID